MIIYNYIKDCKYYNLSNQNGLALKTLIKHVISVVNLIYKTHSQNILPSSYYYTNFCFNYCDSSKFKLLLPM